MIDKRAIMREMKIARMGLTRRIQLRTRTVTASTVASVDVLASAAPDPSTDELTVITGQFTLSKSVQDYAEEGVMGSEIGVVYFHPKFQTVVQNAYSMYIGGTKKEWKKVSPMTFDDARSALKVIVEAEQ